jgi:hypothetical protein
MERAGESPSVSLVVIGDSLAGERPFSFLVLFFFDLVI